MPGATRSIVINTSIDKLFSVIADYQSYPQFLPEVKSIRVSKRQGAEMDVHYEVEVLKRIRYTLHLKEERPNRISWSFVEGEVMRDNRGHWLLEPLGQAQTRATYTIEMALGPLVPKPLVSALVETSLPKMLEAFKKRAESSG